MLLIHSNMPVLDKGMVSEEVVHMFLFFFYLGLLSESVP